MKLRQYDVADVETGGLQSPVEKAVVILREMLDTSRDRGHHSLFVNLGKVLDLICSSSDIFRPKADDIFKSHALMANSLSLEDDELGKWLVNLVQEGGPGDNDNENNNNNNNNSVDPAQLPPFSSSSGAREDGGESKGGSGGVVDKNSLIVRVDTATAQVVGADPPTPMGSARG
jgi:hypothetical protein